MSIVIAIDGPAASGKSSVARLLAQEIGFAYVNSGSFYRVVTWWMARQGVDLTQEAAVQEALEKGEISAGFENGEAYFRLNGEADLEAIHQDEVNRGVSYVAKVPAVRTAVTDNLRRLVQQQNAVVEGRDIGSVVFPDTPFKFYIDASPEVRQQRRAAQGQVDTVTERDRIDSSRANAPLTIAQGAYVIDSTHLSIAEGVAAVRERLNSLDLSTSVR